MLEGLRLFLLFSFVANLLLSTVLYRAAGRPFIDWYTRTFKFPVEIQRFLSHDRVLRVWGFGNAGLSLVAWWYLGTSEGESAFRALVPQRMP
jgi:hypothetical protein